MSNCVAGPLESARGVLLSRMEEGFWRGNLRVAVVVRLEGWIERDILERALVRVQQRHPKLRATMLQGADGRCRYHPNPAAPPIALDVEDCADEGETPWREATHRLLQLGPPPVGPVAAVCVLRNRARTSCELIVSAHHGIADGRSGLVLVDDILTEYATAESGAETAPCLPLPLVSAARSTRPIRWRERLWLLRRFLRMQLAENRVAQTSLPVSHGIPPLSQWVHWVLSSEETLALIRRCRREGVSPSGALVAVAYRSLLECLPASDALFKWQCPFEVRDGLHGSAGPITADDLGSFIGVMRGLDIVHSAQSLWDLARKVHGDVQAFVRHGGPGWSYRLSALVLSPRLARAGETILPAATPRPTLFFTNYGVVSIRDAYSRLRPRECTLMFRDRDGAGPHLTLEALVLGQRLNIGLAADGLEPAFWDRLQVAVRTHLHAAAVA